MKVVLNSKKIGTIIFIIGIIYMIIVAWLVSWWYVPGYRQSGPEFVSGSSWYTSIGFFIIWSLSAPLGSMLVILGFGLSVHIEKNRILYFIVGSIVLLLWLALWNVSYITSTLYGIGGGIIIICFIISIWSWANKRSSLQSKSKLAADLRVSGHLFFLIAAWGICGVLGTPMFGLRPELMIKFQTEYMAYTMGGKVLICLSIGWIFTGISQYIETKSTK